MGIMLIRRSHLNAAGVIMGSGECEVSLTHVHTHTHTPCTCRLMKLRQALQVAVLSVCGSAFRC